MRHANRSDRLGAERVGHGAHRGPRATGPRWRRSSPSSATAIRPQARIDALDVAEIACQADRREARGRQPAFPIRTSAWRRPAPQPTIPADLATCDALPGRDRRPGRAPLSLPVYQLHQLRAAMVDHPATALRPAADFDGRVRVVPGLPGGVRAIRPTGGFTPSRSPVRECGPALRCSDRRWAASWPLSDGAGGGRGRVGRAGRGPEGLGRLPTPGRCDQRRGGGPAAPAKAAARPAAWP